VTLYWNFILCIISLFVSAVNNYFSSTFFLIRIEMSFFCVWCPHVYVIKIQFVVLFVYGQMEFRHRTACEPFWYVFRRFTDRLSGNFLSSWTKTFLSETDDTNFTDAKQQKSDTSIHTASTLQHACGWIYTGFAFRWLFNE